MATLKPLIAGSLRILPTPEGNKRLVGAAWPGGELFSLCEIASEDVPTDEIIDGEIRGWGWDADSVLLSNGAIYVDPNVKNQILYTTAPEAYDYGCTATLEEFECAVYPPHPPRKWRKIIIRGEDGFARGQVVRYHSGINAVSEEDPRDTRRRWDEARATEGADQDSLDAMTVERLEAEVERRETLSGEGTGDMRHRAYQTLARKRREANEAAKHAQYTAMVAKLQGKVLLPYDLCMEVTHIYPPIRDRPVDCCDVLVRKDDGGIGTLTVAEAVRMLADDHVAPASVAPLAVRTMLWKAGINPLTAEKVPIGDKDFYVGLSRRSINQNPIVVDADTGKVTRRRAVVENVVRRFLQTK